MARSLKVCKRSNHGRDRKTLRFGQRCVKVAARTMRGARGAREWFPLQFMAAGRKLLPPLAPLRELAAILRSESGRNTIFTLDIEGVGASEVMFHDRQIDPVRGRLIHADLTRLVKGQKIEVLCRCIWLASRSACREEQGVLEQIIREIEIRCEPREIPDVDRMSMFRISVFMTSSRFRHSGGRGH